MNFTDINGQQCRIMWSRRDPSIRISGTGNVFMKNLHPSVDNKGLYDMFSDCGHILSCKVAVDENGNSKCYGFVNFETDESAKTAITKYNGTLIQDMRVFVGPFVRRQNRWTKLYFKNIPMIFNEAKVVSDIFCRFGDICSCWIARDTSGNSKGFGFVEFCTHAAAKLALEQLTDSIQDDGVGGQFQLYVNRAQTKTERESDKLQRYRARQTEFASKGLNLYVRNIDGAISNATFSAAFLEMGAVTSARIMRTADGTSKGFGYVCFSTPDEAARAIEQLDGQVLGSRRIFVSLYQCKEQREAEKKATYGNGSSAPWFTAGLTGAPLPYPPFGPMPYASLPHNPYGYAGLQLPTQPEQQYHGYRDQVFVGYGFNPPRQHPLSGMQMSAPRGYACSMPTHRGVGGAGGMGGRAGGPHSAYGGGARRRRGAPAPVPRSLAAPVAAIVPAASAAASVVASATAFDERALAAADPQTQKNMMGERLYPLIHKSQPALAGKITGMILELDNAEVLNLLETPEELQLKIEEALAVLQRSWSENKPAGLQESNEPELSGQQPVHAA